MVAMNVALSDALGELTIRIGITHVLLCSDCSLRSLDVGNLLANLAFSNWQGSEQSR